MKFLVVLALVAVCLPAAFAYECSGCDLDGAWRATVSGWINNDDELIGQGFDGQIEWRDEWLEFGIDENRYLSCLGSEGSCSSLQNTARTSCKEAKPDRVYNFRWERDIDDDDYAVSMFLHKGFHPSDDVWDRYCRIRIDTPTRQVFVESTGSRTFSELKGAIAWNTEGLMEEASNDEGGNCRAIFRPKLVQQKCYLKNNDQRFPTEKYCADWQGSFYQFPSNRRHEWGGARSHARWGCEQYTWDSDSNDDNIEANCERMYFVNTYNSHSEFELGQIRGVNLVGLTSVTTPGDLCEYRISGNTWFGLAGINPHSCQ